MPTRSPRLLLGAQVSIAQRIPLAFERGASIGCSTIQIFTKSNRQWGAKEITQQEIYDFQNMRKQFSISPVVAHATYLINIGSSDKQILQKSVKALTIELERCTLLDIPYLVLHPGSFKGSTEQKCLDQIATSINYVFEHYTGKTRLLLETMAGQGTSVCYRFEQISHVIGQVTQSSKRLGVCLDTCHVFAAGYDLRTPKAYNDMWQQFDETIGLGRLYAIHVNDSKKELGSRVDRHEKIGKGEIGLKAFELLFNDPRLFAIPKILETPEGTLDDYAVDIRTILELLSAKTRKILGVKNGDF
ncbi:deoxyribonuclease IV [Candidatus Dependentiae bacterium]|nr:deoxyribonuclease IV [Candidatus Dependentiae bacterium]